MEFTEFPKIARLSRDIVVTEKIDGTNAQVHITEDGDVLAGSRSRYITPQDDNFGFARWVDGNRDELMKPGPGRHYGEWWGLGIQRGYELKEKRLTLFNVKRWEGVQLPVGITLVPVLYRGPFTTDAVDACLARLRDFGSVVSPGFLRPEGVIVYHTASGALCKKTIEGDEKPKSDR